MWLRSTRPDFKCRLPVNEHSLVFPVAPSFVLLCDRDCGFDSTAVLGTAPGDGEAQRDHALLRERRPGESKRGRTVLPTLAKHKVWAKCLLYQSFARWP